MYWSNPIKPPESTVGIVIRAEYLKVIYVRGTCLGSKKTATQWLTRLLHILVINGNAPQRVFNDFNSYFAQVRQAGNKAVCFYASAYSVKDNELFYIQRRATIEHEHAHAIIGEREVRTSGRWMFAIDRVMYGTCGEEWLNLKSSVNSRYFEGKVKKTAGSTVNAQVVNEAMARVAAMLHTANTSRDNSAIYAIAQYQLRIDPLSLFYVSRSIYLRFKTFNKLVEYVDKLPSAQPPKPISYADAWRLGDKAHRKRMKSKAWKRAVQKFRKLLK